jgi:hypothetical protein
MVQGDTAKEKPRGIPSKEATAITTDRFLA